LVTGFDAIYELFDRAVTTLFALAAVPALCALPLSGTTRFKPQVEAAPTSFMNALFMNMNSNTWMQRGTST
jgi:hypothetical protein